MALSCEPQRLRGSIEAPTLDARRYRGAIEGRCGSAAAALLGGDLCELARSLAKDRDECADERSIVWYLLPIGVVGSLCGVIGPL
jgi:hypothetical protein